MDIDKLEKKLDALSVELNKTKNEIKNEVSGVALLSTLVSSIVILVILIIILGIILGVVLVATNPDENKVRNAILKEQGATGRSLVELGKLLGVVEIEYNDYLVFSTLMVKSKDSKEEPLAVGIAGQVFTKDRLQRLRETFKKE